MIERQPHRKPEVELARRRFISRYNEDALALLKAADDVLLNKPEKGTATSKRGVFSIKIGVPEQSPIFIFEFSYSYTAQEVKIETFNWVPVHPR